MQSKRINWIDIARGIGIIFVIYAHLLGRYDHRYIIYAFHIPLFFFLSGMLFKSYGSFWIFLKKSAKGLLIPYFAFAFISYILWLTGHHTWQFFTFNNLRQFGSIFYGNSNNNLMVFNNVLWFLPALFIIRIMFAGIFKLTEKTKTLILIAFLFSVFGYLYSLFINIKLPFGTETAFSGIVFYSIGFLWMNSEKAKTIVSRYKYLLFPVLIIISAWLATVNFNWYGYQIDMRLSHLCNYFLFYIAAFCGIFAWIGFSIILGKNRVLEKIGKSALVLFSWHPTVFNYFNLFFPLIGFSAVLAKIKIFVPAIYTILAITVIILVTFVVKKLWSYSLLFLRKPRSLTKQ